MTVPIPVTPADATRAVPPPAPNEVRRLQRMIQDALANGYSRREISAQMEKDRGLTLADFERMTEVSPRNIGRSGLMGALSGLGDELAGVGEMMASGTGYTDTEAYRRGRESVREPYETFRAAHPVASAAAEFGGGLLGPGLTGARVASQAPGLLRAGLTGTGVGAASGALAGAGYADELKDVPGGMLASGLLGGILGGGLGLGGDIAMRTMRGGAGPRLERAIEASGGEASLRRAAQQSVEAGRGRVQPIGSLTPYLRGEAEYAATRSPAVFGRQQGRLQRTRAGDAERLIRDVSDITQVPAVGREALVEARSQALGPVYEAIAAKSTPLPAQYTKEVVDILQRPYVQTAYQEAVNEGLLAGQKAAQPGFKALNNLRQHLRSAQDRAFTANDGARGAAFKQAADDLESILEKAVPEFRVVQNAYREASRPVNIIDLAKLETSRQGRVSPMLDQASRELRRDLLKAFGSPEKYRAFMRRVAAEGDIAQFTAQVLGGSATARRLSSTAGVEAEDVVGAGLRPTGLLTRAVQRVVPRAIHERAARQIEPFVFAPTSDFEEALRRLRELGRRQSSGPLMRGAVPAASGVLSGSLTR